MMKNAFAVLAIVGWIWTVVAFLWITMKLRSRRQMKQDEKRP
jgi:hypothetical protein